MVDGLFQGKSTNKGVEDMEFQGVLKKEYVEILGLFQNKPEQGGWGQGVFRVLKRMWKFQGSIKKEVKFPGVFKKNSCGIFLGPGFWNWNFQVVSRNFAEYPWVKACFLSGISRGQVTNLKIPGVFFRKVYPQSPLSSPTTGRSKPMSTPKK